MASLSQVSQVVCAFMLLQIWYCFRVQKTNSNILYSHCGDNGTSVCGGLNNARNRIQTCVRLAIDAGMGLILPSAMTRDEAKLTNTGKVTVSADKFWNIERLQTILKKSCPQLKLRRNNDRSGIDTIIDAPLRLFFQEPYTRGTFRHLIQQALQDSDLGYTEITHPVAVSFGDSYTVSPLQVCRDTTTENPLAVAVSQG
jgi:hypothetical protein